MMVNPLSRSLMWAIALSPALSLTSASNGFAYTAVDKYSITPAEHAACDGDAARLCSAAFPDEDKLLSCMSAKTSELTPVCLVTFKAGMKRRHLAN